MERSRFTWYFQNIHAVFWYKQPPFVQSLPLSPGNSRYQFPVPPSPDQPAASRWKTRGMDGQPSMTERTALEPKSFIIQFRIYPPNLESEFGYITYHITNIKTSSFHITIRCSSFWGSEKRWPANSASFPGSSAAFPGSSASNFLDFSLKWMTLSGLMFWAS